MTLAGKHILVTAGPTHEPIDPVRVLANRSSGRQGFAIAAAENHTSLANFLRARLPHAPTLGDRIRLGDIDLVVRGMNGERITRALASQAGFASLSC